MPTQMWVTLSKGEAMEDIPHSVIKNINNNRFIFFLSKTFSIQKKRFIFAI